MTPEEIAVTLKAHEKDIHSMEYRVNDLEAQTDTINKLVVSVEKMALAMQNMVDTMQDHNKRLENIEKRPADSWNTLKKTILSAIVTTLVGAALGALITLVVK